VAPQPAAVSSSRLPHKKKKEKRKERGGEHAQAHKFTPRESAEKF